MFNYIQLATLINNETVRFLDYYIPCHLSSETVVYAMSSDKNMYRTNNATSENVFAIILKGNLIFKFAEYSYIIANNPFRLIAISLYNNKITENILFKQLKKIYILLT